MNIPWRDIYRLHSKYDLPCIDCDNALSGYCEPCIIELLNLFNNNINCLDPSALDFYNNIKDIYLVEYCNNI